MSWQWLYFTSSWFLRSIQPVLFFTPIGSLLPQCPFLHSRKPLARLTSISISLHPVTTDAYLSVTYTQMLFVFLFWCNQWTNYNIYDIIWQRGPGDTLPLPDSSVKSGQWCCSYQLILYWKYRLQWPFLDSRQPLQVLSLFHSHDNPCDRWCLPISRADTNIDSTALRVLSQLSSIYFLSFPPIMLQCHYAWS